MAWANLNGSTEDYLMPIDPLLPAFILIGAPKTGTVSIHQYLRQHPLISLPIKKETHFFIADSSSNSQKSYYDLSYPNAITNISAYKDLFENPNPAAIRGEVCPSYLAHPHAAENIFRYSPDCKLIAILRDPTERFYSNTRFYFNNLSKKTTTDVILTQKLFEEEVIKLIKGQGSIQFQRFFNDGLYFANLQRFYQLFPSANIKIFLYRELVQDSNALLNQMIGMLGLPEFEFDTDKKFNTSGEIRNIWFYRSIKKLPYAKHIRKWIKPVTYEFLRQKFEMVIIGKKEKNITDLARKTLIDLYRDDILALEDLIDKDLSGWIRV